MATKRFFFDFYVCDTKSAQEVAIPLRANDIFRRLHDDFHEDKSKTVKGIGKNLVEIRDIVPTDYGFKGIIGKHRKSNLPHAAIAGGNERELPLGPNENLLEKSHFLYYSDLSLLIIQRNRFCANWEVIGKFLSPANYVTTLNPVIEPASLEWLARGEVQVKVADITIARPLNPEFFEHLEHDFNNSILSTLNGAQACKINLSLRGEARSDDPENRYLDPSFKRALRELQQRFEVQKLRLTTEDSETRIEHPIDLVSDRLSHYDNVEMAGKYPVSFDMWNKLEQARNAKDNELTSYFGTRNNRLA